MRSPDVIILGGSPSSGKSEIGHSFAAIETNHSVSYVPAEIYQPIAHDTRVLVGSGAQMRDLPPERPMEPVQALRSLLQENRADLMIVDDAALSLDNVNALNRYTNILAVCNVSRTNEQTDETMDTSALKALRYQQRHPFFELNGARPVFENVAALRSIYVACRTYDMRRPGNL